MEKDLVEELKEVQSALDRERKRISLLINESYRIEEENNMRWKESIYDLCEMLFKKYNETDNVDVTTLDSLRKEVMKLKKYLN